VRLYQPAPAIVIPEDAGERDAGGTAWTLASRMAEDRAARRGFVSPTPGRLEFALLDVRSPAAPISFRADGLLVLAVALVTLAVQWPLRLRMISMIDEGAILQVSAEILNGRLPYRDAIHYAFPGIFYVLAGAFAVAGTSTETARAVACGLFAVTTVAAYLIARWWYGRAGACGVVLLFLIYRLWAYPHWQMVSYSTLAIACLLPAAWLVGEAFGRRGRWRLVVAGLAVGGAILAKQDSGGLGAVALTLGILVAGPGILRERVRDAAWLVAGAAAVFLLLGVVLLATGTAGAFVEATLLLPLQGLQTFTYLDRPALWPLWHQDRALRVNILSYLPPALLDPHFFQFIASPIYLDTIVVDVVMKLLYHLPWILALSVLAVELIRRMRSRDVALTSRRRLLLAVLATLLLAAFNRPRDWVHLMVLYPPTLLLLASLRPRTARTAWLLGVPVWLLLGALSVASVRLAVDLGRWYSTPVHTPRGTIYGTAAQATEVGELLAVLARSPAPHAPLLALPYHPLVNFLAARPLLSRNFIVWPAGLPEDRDRAIIAALEAHPDAEVVYSPSRFPNFPPLQAYAPLLYGELAEHYPVADVVGGSPGSLEFLVLRRTDVPPGRSLLGAALRAATVEIVPDAGPPRVVAADERSRLVGETQWPFTPVLWVGSLPGASIEVVYGVVPEQGARFASGFGVDPDQWLSPSGTQARFRVAVRADGVEQQLWETGIDPARRPEERRWASVDLDLGPWAGRRIDLVLRARGPAAVGGQPGLIGWARPRLVGGAQVEGAAAGP
jgi:hypothetical protein